MGNLTDNKLAAAFTPLLIAGLLLLIRTAAQPQSSGINFDHVGTGCPAVFKVISGSGVRMDTLGVSVILGAGYAVVREAYGFRNAGDKAVIQAVVPGGGYFRAGILDTVTYGNPYDLRVSMNGHGINAANDTMANVPEYSRWSFTVPRGYSKLILHYLVNTHNAVLRRGHDVENAYGFAYRFNLLKRSAFKPATVGIAVVFDQSVRYEKIEGLIPFDQWFAKAPVYSYMPDSSLQNAVIRYGKTSIYRKSDDFDMNSVTARSTWLYDQSDTVKVWSAGRNDFQKVSKTDFMPEPVTDYSLYGMAILAILGAGAVLALLGPMIWGAWKRRG